MKTSIFLILRRVTLAWALVFGAGVILAPPVVSVAAAKKRRGKRRSRTARVRPRRDIRPAADLAPKKEHELDESIRKTKDFKPTADTGGPTLTPAELSRRTTEALVDEKLDEEIELTRQLKDLQTGCEAAPPSFRLAELYWEKSKRAFFKSQDFSTPEGERKTWERRMKKLQVDAIGNYRWIADECPDFPEYAKTLFFLGRAMNEVDRPADGVQYFQRIIREFPDSQWVGDAWFMVGEYFFNVANKADKALRAYTHTEEYPNCSSYGYAVYKQGWCYINLAEWKKAAERFRTVVTISEDTSRDMDQKGRISLRREGLRDFVRAYHHFGNSRDAFRELLRVGGKGDVQWLMEALGNWYINEDAHADVQVVYNELIKQYPQSLRTPLWQGRIVRSVARMDKKAVVPQAKRLTKFFRRVRARIARGDLSQEDKKNVKKDMNEAEEIAENTLRELAMDFHKEAKKLHGQASDRMLRLAHDLYKEYLTVFPEPKPGAEVNYVFYMRFYYAEVLYRIASSDLKESAKFAEAADNYDKVVDMNPHPKDPKEKEIVLDAAEESVRSYKELVEDLHRKNPPEISGTEPKPIPEVEQRFIHACQRYIDYIGSGGDKIVEIRYMMARTYYLYNHLDEAAPAFNDIVTHHPAHEVACFAANYTLDIYNGENNYRALKETARSYLDNKRLSCGQEDRKKFAQIEEQSSFKVIELELEGKKRNLAAANAYMQFYKSFPTSQYADDAVSNAAVNYDLAQRLDQANEVRRFLVEKMPVCKAGETAGCAEKDLVQKTLFNIATSYERIVDFSNAAHYLELFVERYPDEKNSKDALYNAGLYRATLHEWDAARADRDKFIKTYPRDDDAQKVAFSICESAEDEARLLERADKNDKRRDLSRQTLKAWQAAHDCYFNYIQEKQYVREDPDSLCQAQWRRGEIMRLKTKYDKGAQEMRQYLLKNWPTWEKRGLDKMPRCASAIAHIELDDLAKSLKKYEGMTIPEYNPAVPKKDKAFRDAVKAKAKERDDLIERYKDVAKLGVAEWSLAALYNIGELYEDTVDKVLKAPIPDKVQGVKVPDDIKQQLRQKLQEMTAGAADSAAEAYRICVNKANELGVYNRWSQRALRKLRELRPLEFPPVAEHKVEVAFTDPIVVATNGVVIPDGESWRSLGITVAADGVKPGDAAASKKRVEANTAKSKAPEAAVEKSTSEPSKKVRRSRRGRRRRRGRGGRE